MGLAAKAASEGDTDSLFWVVDERARHAMDGIVKARKRAEEVIVMGYPMELQGDAIAAFDGVAGLSSGRELFQERCDQACLDWFAQNLSAPLTIRKEGNVAHVTTVRGTKVSLFRDKSGRYGVSWNTKELARERTRAFAELELIERNAKQYARGRALR